MSSFALEERECGVRFEVWVVPRASREGVVGIHEGRLKIALAAAPVDGEANAALVAFVARRLGVPRSRVRLCRGATARRKMLEVDGVDAAQVRARLGGGSFDEQQDPRASCARTLPGREPGCR